MFKFIQDISNLESDLQKLRDENKKHHFDLKQSICSLKDTIANLKEEVEALTFQCTGLSKAYTHTVDRIKAVEQEKPKRKYVKKKQEETTKEKND